jgi:WD40 repeat protein
METAGTAFVLWDTVAGEQLLKEPTHESGISSLAFVPDGRTLVSGSFDGTIRFWDRATGRHLRQFPGQYGSLRSVAVLPDGKALLACSERWLSLRDLGTGKELRRLSVEDAEERKETLLYFGIQEFRLSQDGRTAATKSQRPGKRVEYRVNVWELATGKELVRRSDPTLLSCVFSPDLQTLAATMREPRGTTAPIPLKGNRITIPESQLVLQEVPTSRQLRAVSQPDWQGGRKVFSPDSQTLVTQTYRMPEDNEGTRAAISTLHLWEVLTGKERLAISLKEGTGLLAFSVDGRILATLSSSGDNALHIWDVATGTELMRQAVGLDALATGLAFSPDAALLATAHTDCTILTWDVSSATRQPSRSVRRATAQELESWWSALAGPDARPAHTAIWRLAAVPEQAVPLLRDRLRPAEAVPEAKLRQLLADLDGGEFARRQQAFEELANLGEPAEPVLYEALRARLSLEQRRRVEQLLTGPRRELPSRALRQLRSVEVLEHCGTAAARQVLTMLERGDPAARLTKNARAALERLARQPVAQD